MNRSELLALVARTLSTIAPEADLTALAGDAPLRDTLDLDSMDFLNFLVALNKATGIEIPESEYAKLQSLDALVGYLAPRLGNE
jgi:acyl carrier protein